MRFLWTHEEVDLVSHPVAGLVLQERDAEKFPQRLVPKAWILLYRASKQSPQFSTSKEDGGDERLVGLELASKADGVAQSDPA